MSENTVDDGGIGEEGEDAQGIEWVDASEELSPAEAGGAGGSRRRVGASVGCRLGGGVKAVEVVGPREADDVGAPRALGAKSVQAAAAVRDLVLELVKAGGVFHLTDCDGVGPSSVSAPQVDCTTLAEGSGSVPR